MLFTADNHPTGFYVYVFLNEDGTPYYVGKGKAGRAFKTSRANHPRDPRRVIIVDWDMSELWAFLLERKLIRWFGRADIGTGILDNLTDGGEGWSGLTPWNKGKSGVQVAWNKGKKMDSPTPEIIEKRVATWQERHGDKPGNRKGHSPWCAGTKGQGIVKAWNKGKEMKKTPCPHCGKMVDALNMKKWHGDKCKHRKSA